MLAFFLCGLLIAANAEAAAEIPPQPKVLKRVGPRIPEKAFKSLTPGDARIRVEIAADGDIVDASIAEEIPEGFGFGREALSAVKKWTFAPGQPGVFILAVSFRWQNEPALPKPAEMPPEAPEPVKRTPPVYPELAVIKKIEGDVRLVVKIEYGRVESGAVILEATVDKDAGLFGDLAMKAVRKWRFADDLNGVFTVTLPFSAKALSEGLVQVAD